LGQHFRCPFGKGWLFLVWHIQEMLGKAIDFSLALDPVQRVKGIPCSFGWRKKIDLAKFFPDFSRRI
jgi:hypothetical protein